MDEGVPLGAVSSALHGAFVELVFVPPGPEVSIRSVSLLDAADLADTQATADLCLVVGVPDAQVVAWLDELALRASGDRPRAVMVKGVTVATHHAARQCGIALLSVHTQARWERLLSMIRGVLDHSVVRTPLDPVGDDTDLYGLARTIATLTKGMVSIEDERSHVLAYSAADDAADELRTLSILGREGPADYLRRLDEWGVFDRIRRSDDIVEVPADETLRIRRRLVVGIRSIPDATGAVTTLGSIWIQEGQQPISADADGVLRGAAAVAARLIKRNRDAPTNEALQIQRLLGARGGRVDVPSLAAALSISDSGPAAVIGFAAIGDEEVAPFSAPIRLHASAFHRSSLATALGGRIYVLFPGEIAVRSLESWTREAIVRIEQRTGIALRAALVAPVAALSDVAAARFEVDRVLDRTTGDLRVTTLAESRTSVLLGEIVELVANHEHLHDPRIESLRQYDAKNASTMTGSLRVYLAHFGDVRAAAEELRVHPNTLRYRIKRVEQILGADLSDPDDRLLIELQLRIGNQP
ncbi:helix-turn-helix domain-containing protein [Rhodococcus sp. G-MC3]|uniref:PucR family transcriptional regulator n=1 Tax=Rhodococcus sp. G-MC3 TaxID=3046209 RepID=UPI0024B9C867|nr:helix-turn-helix domain-containing protein [Rhodococcus sp. G-MC3]MDJ0392551.1 helix-turn-helix domain-containing protein [Rhodococcus sp. G-MC3]